MTYTINKSDGSALTTIYPFETDSINGVSSPFQVVCRPEFIVVGVVGTNILVSGNVAQMFRLNYIFVIAGINYTCTANATYNIGLNQTTIITSGPIPSIGSIIEHQVFLILGDFVNNPPARFIAGFQIEIQHMTNPLAANVGVYTLIANATFDTISGYTVLPVVQPILQSEPFTGQYRLVYRLLAASSTLQLIGTRSINWGEKVLENLVRMTENFASNTAPDLNPNLGPGPASVLNPGGQPLIGQLWYDTNTQTFKFYRTTGFPVGWVELGQGIGTIGGTVPSTRTITAVFPLSITNAGILNTDLTLSILQFGSTNSGVVPSSGGGTINYLRADGTWSAPSGVGTVTSINATGSTGLTVGGGPITSSGTLTFVLNAELQGLSSLTGTGVVQRTGVHTYAVSNSIGGIEIGFRDIPQNIQVGVYQLVIGDRSRHILASNNVIIPSGVFAAGAAITVVNNTSGNISIIQGGGMTLRHAGTATTGNRILAQRGLVTVLYISSNEGIISGAGLS